MHGIVVRKIITIESLPIVNKELKWIWGNPKEEYAGCKGKGVIPQKHQKPIYSPRAKQVLGQA